MFRRPESWVAIPGMLDMVVSCPACCGCWAKPAALALSETTTSANARRRDSRKDNEIMAHPKFEYGRAARGGRRLRSRARSSPRLREHEHWTCVLALRR